MGAASAAPFIKMQTHSVGPFVDNRIGSVLTSQSFPINFASIANAERIKLTRIDACANRPVYVSSRIWVQTAFTGVSSDFATLTTAMVGNNNDIVLTAVDPGADGNDITITLVNPGTALEPLAVAVAGTDISVTLETGAGPGNAILTTASELIDAINADEDASALVVATLAQALGTGVVIALAETPLDGGADFAAVVDIGTASVGNYLNDDASLASTGIVNSSGQNVFVAATDLYATVGFNGTLTAGDAMLYFTAYELNTSKIE